MGGAFSYASFSRSGRRAGGWGVGDKVGDLTQEELQLLISYVPTSLNTGKSVPDFPSPQERAELVRRTAVFALSPEADKWVTMVSVPAGLDATGRGGNVFTYTCLTRDGVPPQPARVLYSPDVPAPFSIFEVDKEPIPLSIVKRGPLHADKLLDEFLDGQFLQPAKLPAPFKAVVPHGDATFNRALVEAMAAVLNTRNGFVILVAPENQAALWIAATARLVGEDGFGFSTYEKAAAIEEFPRSTSTMIVVPPGERQRLKEAAISGKPVIFDLDSALPDVSAYQPKDSTQPLGSGDAAPVAIAPESSIPEPSIPAEPLPAAVEKGESDSPFADPFAAAPFEIPSGLPNSSANPFAEAAPDPASPDASSPVSSVPSVSSVSKERPDAEPSRCNAIVPELSEVERSRLEHFDPAWWINHLCNNPGRSIQLALLDPHSLPESERHCMMAAVLASWVFSFPPEFTLLADSALKNYSLKELQLMRALTIDKFSMQLNLATAQPRALGPLGQDLYQLLQDMRAAAAQHMPPQHPNGYPSNYNQQYHPGR